MAINKISRLFIITFAFFIMTSLNSAYSANSNWYGGINIGTGDVDFPGYEDSDTISLFAGNKISNQMSVEFGYTDLGEFEVIGFPDIGVEVTGFEASVVGKMATGNTIELFGRLGVYLWDVDFPFPNAEDSGTSITFGVGVDMHFSQNFGGRIAFQHYGDVSDVDITNISFGVFTSF